MEPGSGHLLKIFSPLGDASVAADAFSREVWWGECGKCEQTTIKKFDSVLRMKLFSPLGGAPVIACRTLRKQLQNGDIIVNRCPRNTIRIWGSDCLT
jgi:hypothetical protein